MSASITRHLFEHRLAGIDEREDLREYIATHMYDPNYESPASGSQWSTILRALEGVHE